MGVFQLVADVPDELSAVRLTLPEFHQFPSAFLCPLRHIFLHRFKVCGLCPFPLLFFPTDLEFVDVLIDELDLLSNEGVRCLPDENKKAERSESYACGQPRPLIFQTSKICTLNA